MHKHYFGIASIIFASACLIWSIGQAIAFPQSPNVSFGSNPIFAVDASGQSGTLFINNTSSTAIITDLSVVQTTSNGYTCKITFSVSNGGDQFSIYGNPYGGVPGGFSLNSGLTVPAGESLTFSGNNSSYCQGASASGYYAH